MAFALPDYRRQVAPGRLPGPRAAAAPAAAFGAGVGASVSAIAADEDRKRNKALSLEMMARAQERLDELWYGEDGGAFKQGEAFFEWEKRDPLGRWRQGLAADLEKLPSGARALAGPLLDGLQQDMARRVMSHAGAARASYYPAKLQGNLDQIATSTALAAADKERDGLAALRQGLAFGGFLIDDFANDHGDLVGAGGVTQFRQQSLQGFQSGLVDGAVRQALAAGNDQLAQQIMEEFGDRLLPDAAVGARAAVGKATDLGDIARTYEELEAALPIEVGDDARAAVEARGGFWRPPATQAAEVTASIRRYGQANDWSQDKIERAVDYADDRIRRRLANLRAQQEETLEALSADLAAYGGDLLALQRAKPREMAFVEQRGRDLLAKEAAGMAGVRSELEEIETYLGFLRMAEEDPAAFRAVSRYELRATLDKTHADELLSLQQTPAGAQSHGSALSRHVGPQGLKLKGEKLRKFTQAAEAWLAEQGGREKVPVVEFQQQLERLSAEVVLSRAWWDVEEPRYLLALEDFRVTDLTPQQLEEVKLSLVDEIRDERLTPAEIAERVRVRGWEAVRLGIFP